jgi:YVTN family beta-propeller protein
MQILGRLPLVVAVAFICATPAAPAAEYVYLENTDSGEISVIDVPGHTVVSTIELGTYLDDVTASKDGTVLYANRAISLGVPRAGRSAESGEIIAISTETEQILWRTPVHGWPNHVTLSADDSLLYVPLFDRPWMEIVDTEKHEVTGKFWTGLGGHGTRLSPDGKRLYVGSMFLDVLSVFDLETLRPVKVIPFKDAVRPFAFTRDEKTLFVQLSRLHGFEVVDLPKGEIVREVALPRLSPDVELPKFYPHTYDHGLALSPDEKLLLAAGSAAGYVCAYSVPELELKATIPVGKEPNWIVFSHDGSFAYVSNRKSDTLSVISVRDLKEINEIKVGRYPQRMRAVVVPKRQVAGKNPKAAR